MVARRVLWENTPSLGPVIGRPMRTNGRNFAEGQAAKKHAGSFSQTSGRGLASFLEDHTSDRDWNPPGMVDAQNIAAGLQVKHWWNLAEVQASTKNAGSFSPTSGRGLVWFVVEKPSDAETSARERGDSPQFAPGPQEKHPRLRASAIAGRGEGRICARDVFDAPACSRQSKLLPQTSTSLGSGAPANFLLRRGRRAVSSRS